QEMMAIVRKDTPWFTGYYPKEYYLNHQWLFNTKRHGISKSTLKYLRIDPELREQKQQQWNQPKLWPLFLIFLGLIALLIPAAMGLYKRQQQTIAVGASNPLNKRHRKEAN
ncbi:MAG: peptide ABC transporter substrate-binding protein, partial [Endozoicomonas sp.]